MGTVHDMIRKLKEFQKEIETITGKTIEILPDKNGMIDKQCPKDECNLLFKISADDWLNIAKDEEFFCPFCRNSSPAEDFLPQHQHESLRNVIQNAIIDNWHFSTPIPNNISSIISSEAFEFNIQCEKCNCRYSVLGFAYFCPCCGYNSIATNAKRSIEQCINIAQSVDSIKIGVELNKSKDDAALVTRMLIEYSLTNCIGILQNFSERKYSQLANTNPPLNAFQNVKKSDELWTQLKGSGYYSWLNQNEIDHLIIYTQRRHLLEHKGGLVDERYLEITKDNVNPIGNKIIVNAKDIISLGNIVLKLIDAINSLE